MTVRLLRLHVQRQKSCWERLPSPYAYTIYLTLAMFYFFAFAYVLLAELYQLVLYLLFQLQ